MFRMEQFSLNSILLFNLQNGLTPLLAAASACHVDTVQLLLERGASINGVDKVRH